MKKLLIIAMLMTSTAAFAADLHAADRAAHNAVTEKRHEERRDEHFSREKAERQHKLANKVSAVQKRLACFQRVQSCVDASTNMASLNACHGDCD